MFDIRLSLLVLSTVISGFSLSSQTNLVAPLSKDKLVTVVSNEQDYLIRLINLDGTVIAEKTLGSLEDLTVRNIQYAGNNFFFIDGKKRGFRVKVDQNDLFIADEREVPFDIKRLKNYFYFFTAKKEVHVQYTSSNAIRVFIYNQSKELVYSENLGFSVNTSKEKLSEYPRFIFQPDGEILTLNSEYDNAWHRVGVSKNWLAQSTFARLPSGKKGVLSRIFDSISNNQYLIISNEGTHEVYKVSDFNKTIPLKDDQFLLGTVDSPPLFIFDNCVYFANTETEGFGKKCF